MIVLRILLLLIYSSFVPDTEAQSVFGVDKQDYCVALDQQTRPNMDVDTKGHVTDDHMTEDSDECSGGEEHEEDDMLAYHLEEEMQTTVTLKKVDSPIIREIRHVREQLLKDVKLIQVPNNVCGQLVPYGANTVPVLTGRGGSNLLMAVSRVGHGKLVFLACWGLGHMFTSRGAKGDLAILHENIITWLDEGREDESQPSRILTLDEKVKFEWLDSKHHIVYCQRVTIVLQNAAVFLDFLQRGGRIVLCTVPGRMLESAPSLIEDYPDFLAACGLLVTDDIVRVAKSGIAVQHDEDAMEEVVEKHFSVWVTSCLEESPDNWGAHARDLDKFFGHFSRKTLQHLRPSVDLLFEKSVEYVDQQQPPSPHQPMKEITPAKMGALQIYHVLCKHGLGHEKVRGVEHFPGDVENADDQLMCAEVEITDRGVKETHFTGYYVAPGKTLIIHITDREDLVDWHIQIGCHRDQLWNAAKFLRRHPEVVVRRKLFAGTQELFSPYGGCVYFLVPGEKKSGIRARLENVIESPIFDLRDQQSVKNWNERRLASGPWADICGKYMAITVPSSSIRDTSAEALTEVMTCWDNVVKAHHELRTTDHEMARREWFVTDTQIRYGLMHAGHPIMAHLNAGQPTSTRYLLDTRGFQPDDFKFWGAFHELGHNMQRSWWTWAGMREVTCNVFVLHALEKLYGIKAAEHPKFTDPGRRKSLSWFLQTEEPGKPAVFMSLAFFIHFVSGFGWNFMQHVFSEYERNRSLHKWLSNQGKIDAWCVETSKMAGYNLVPLHDLWHLPVSEKAEQQLQDLPPALPDDYFTSLAGDRSQKIAEKYPGLVMFKPSFH